MTRRQNIIQRLYNLQEDLNDLHEKDEDEGTERLIEKAYKALDEAIRSLEA